MWYLSVSYKWLVGASGHGYNPSSSTRVLQCMRPLPVVISSAFAYETLQKETLAPLRPTPLPDTNKTTGTKGKPIGLDTDAGRCDPSKPGESTVPCGHPHH